MDSTCKQAFIVIFVMPILTFLIFVWIIMGSETFKSGILEGISYVFIPTIILAAIGGLVDRIFFEQKLLNCLMKKKEKKGETV